VQAAPRKYQARLKTRFDHILSFTRILYARDSWGRLTALETGPDGRPRPAPATITYTTWYPINRDGPDDPYLDEFTITGWLPAGFDPEAARRVLTPFPPYDIHPNVDPAGPSDQFAIVYLATHARLPAVPNAYLEWYWDPHTGSRTQDPVPIFQGFRDASAGDVRRVAYHARRLLGIRGGIRGRYPDEGVCSWFKQDLAREIPKLREAMWEDEGNPSRPLRQTQLAKALGFSVRTLQNRLDFCKISWEKTRRRMS
jgi:hypothetical protein